MPSRRAFMTGGLTLSALPMLGKAGFASAFGPEKPPLNIGAFMHDTQLVSGQAFARRLRQRGVEVIGASGDWTPVWLDRLDLQLRSKPVAIAGLTPHGPMFTFEGLTRNLGMRLVYSAELTLRHDSCSLAICGASGVVEQAAGLDVDPANWGTHMADLFMQVPEDEMLAPVRETVAFGPRVAVDDDPVYAWVIAPVKGAPRFV